MNRTAAPLLTALIMLGNLSLSAQVKGIKRGEEDYQKYKQLRKQEFNQYRTKREETLAKMTEEYTRYVDAMHKLKRHYSGKNDKANVTRIESIINYETKVKTASTIPVNIRPALKTGKASIAKKPKKTGSTLSGKPAISTALIPALLPVPSSKARITSPFGLRMHPILHRPIRHNGIDFGTGSGVPVYSTADGIVTEACYNRSYGNYLVINHGNEISTVYAHLSRITRHKGDRVNHGEIIGYTGCTGLCTGPHLHYEIRENGVPVDPQTYLSVSR